MARRARGGRPKPVPAKVPASAPLNAPFAALKQRLRAAPPAPPAPRPAPPAPPAAVDDPTLFARAMTDVRPLASREGRRVDGPAPAAEPRPPVSEEAEAFAVLSDLVNGETAFDVTETREYVEGMVVGLDPRLVRRLRRGDFAWQAHLDLHGMVAESARAATEAFLADGMTKGHRCVLIVHGRGLNSKDQTPVLKERLKTWLARGRMARTVLAFATARPVDGGAGALYVLLRRDRRKRTIRVHDGAKA